MHVKVVSSMGKIYCKNESGYSGYSGYTENGVQGLGHCQNFHFFAFTERSVITYYVLSERTCDINMETNNQKDTKKEKMSLSCHQCDQTFLCISSIRAHERNHTEEKSFSCKLCKKSLTTQGNLTLHMIK